MLLKKIVISCFFFFFIHTHALYAQTDTISTLKSLVKKQKDTTRVKTLCLLANAYLFVNLDTAQLFANLARQEAIHHAFEWGKQKSAFLSAQIAYENTPSQDIMPTIATPRNWFKKNNYLQDEIECLLFYSTVKSTQNGKLSVALLDEYILEKAQRSKNSSLIGQAWQGIEKHKPHLLDNAQNHYPGSLDSAIFYFKLTGDSVRLLLAEISEQLKAPGNPLIFEKCRLATEYSLKSKSTLLKIRQHAFMAINHAVHLQDDSTQHYLNKSIEFANYLGSKRNLIGIYKIKGYAYARQDRLPEALKNYQTAYDYAITLGNRVEGINILRQIISIHSLNGDYELATNLLIGLIEEAKVLHNAYLLNSGRRALGDIYVKMKNYEKAKTIYHETIAWSNTALSGSVQSNMQRVIFTELGHIYRVQNQFEKALFYYTGDTLSEHVAIWRKIDANFGLTQTYLDMGNTKKAVKEYNRILAEYPMGLIKKQSYFLLITGRVLIAQQQYEEGIAALENYLGNSKKALLQENKLAAYFDLYEANKAIGNHQKSLYYFENHQNLNYKLTEGKSAQNVQKMQADYELSLKESEIERLKQGQQISALKLAQQNNELALKKLYITLLVFSLLALCGIGYLVFRRLQLKKEVEKNEIKKEAEIKQLKSQQKASIAEIKNNLYANVSHEIKTPLTLIRVPLERFRRLAKGADKVVYDSLIKNTDYLLEMLNELLDVSRADANVIKLHPTLFNFAGFMAQIKVNFTPLFEDKNIDFSCNLKLDNDYYYGDENRLNSVMSNLLKNAYSNTPKNGSVICTVALNEKLTVSITNSGTQINTADLPHIFERFYRSSDTAYAGTGIGLAWSKQVIELHKGSIAVDNSHNNQVTFRFQLPVSKKMEKTMPHWHFKKNIPLVTNKHSPTNTKNLPHVLIVEDNLEMQKLLNDVLNEDFRLAFAADGEVGEQMAIELQPDLILSDVMMPKKDGFELLKALKENFNSSHIPIVMLTARTGHTNRLNGLNQNADAYIEKPFNAEELRAKMKNLLRQRKKLHKLFSQNPFLYSKKTKANPIDTDFMKRAQQIVEKHVADGSFSVNDFCTALALNRTSVNTKLKALTNQSIAEYIKNFRLIQAAKMLLDKDVPIIEIATETGFNNPQVFNKAFKKKYNCTPSAFRTRKQQQA